LETALFEYGNDPGYHLELTVDRDTDSTLRNIFDNEPLLSSDSQALRAGVIGGRVITQLLCATPECRALHP